MSLDTLYTVCIYNAYNCVIHAPVALSLDTKAEIAGKYSEHFDNVVKQHTECASAACRYTLYYVDSSV